MLSDFRNLWQSGLPVVYLSWNFFIVTCADIHTINLFFLSDLKSLDASEVRIMYCELYVYCEHMFFLFFFLCFNIAFSSNIIFQLIGLVVTYVGCVI